MADWSSFKNHATITVFNDHLSDPEEIVARLSPFDVICVMRERTPLSRDVFKRLSRLKLIASTGSRNASIDVAAAAEYGIEVAHTTYDSSSTVELDVGFNPCKRAQYRHRKYCSQVAGSALWARVSGVRP
jgi:lactate dehydrogenase-like 2-hydroxyacid dehydrogenase